jgi:hypothetical protein
VRHVRGVRGSLDGGRANRFHEIWPKVDSVKRKPFLITNYFSKSRTNLNSKQI